MSDTDIYKKREPMPYGSRPSRRSGRQRRSKYSQRPFDHNNRKRRSRNSGLRRLLHLYRKEENEKFFWWTVATALIVVLVALAVWQFVVREQLIREQEQKDEHMQPEQSMLQDMQPSAAE